MEVDRKLTMDTSIAKINLDNLRHNIREYQTLLGETTKIIAVIKADAYGHGVLPVYRAAKEEGIDFFAVSRIKEGIELVKAGAAENIIVLGGTLPSEMKTAVKYSLIPAIYDIEQLKALQKANSGNDAKARFHLKIDTGMNRLGIKCGEDLEKFLDMLDSIDSVHLTGAFSHFAVSDSDAEFTMEQYKLFVQAMHQIRARDYIPKTHISNSAAIASYENFNLDYVRLGIGMYGLNPQDKILVDIKPVMSLSAKIVHINHIKTGDTVSYGRTYKADGDRKIAVLPIGYADGYPRILGNKAQALVRGQRCNVIGTVCMDHIMVDITDVREAACGDDVVLIGKQEQEEITAKELADIAGTIHYEIVTGIQKRVKREYVK